jgi:cytochrome c-type biogenesis protein CcmH
MTFLRRALPVVLLAAVFAFPVIAAERYYHFENDSQQARYEALTRQLRCLVCQGESIADSHADLAKDLRSQVHRMILNGKSDADIIDFMVQRYGDFVLYRPPVKPTTWVLWMGPFALFATAVAVMLLLARRSRGRESSELTPEERSRLKATLGQRDEEGGRS